MIIDIHSHLTFSDFDDDRDSILEEMKEKGVVTITVGTSHETSFQAVRLAAASDRTAATVGVHPTENEVFRAEDFQDLITEHVVAVGECGLDYFRGREYEELQRSNFASQIEFAIENKLPLMIHGRPANHSSNAYHDIADIMQGYSRDWSPDVPKGDMHFFAGDIESARRLLDLGFTLSFDGPITFTHEYDEVISYCPLDMIHAETDAPFAAPVPFRGRRCTPLMVLPVIQRIAEIKNVSLEEMYSILWKNAHKTFPKLANALR